MKYVLRALYCLGILFSFEEVQAQYKNPWGAELSVSAGQQKYLLHAAQGWRSAWGLGYAVHAPVIWHKLHVFAGASVQPQFTSGTLLRTSDLIRSRCVYAALHAGVEYRLSVLHPNTQLAFLLGNTQALNLYEYNVWNAYPRAGFPALWARNLHMSSAGLALYLRRGNREKKIQFTVDGTVHKGTGGKQKMQFTGCTLTLGILQLDAPKKKISDKHPIYRTLSGRASPD